MDGSEEEISGNFLHFTISPKYIWYFNILPSPANYTFEPKVFENEFSRLSVVVDTSEKDKNENWIKKLKTRKMTPLSWATDWLVNWPSHRKFEKTRVEKKLFAKDILITFCGTHRQDSNAPLHGPICFTRKKLWSSKVSKFWSKWQIRSIFATLDACRS